MGTTLGPVTAGARHRLTSHYGPAVTGWLDEVPAVIATTIARWDLDPAGYCDAGHASVIALAADQAGCRYVVKAWYDRHRCVHELAALRRWPPGYVAAVARADGQAGVAAIEMIGDRPGGAGAPADEYAVVAASLARLHTVTVRPGSFPGLACYLRDEVVPRIRRRMVSFGRLVPEPGGELGIAALADICRAADASVLVHGDLYRQNVLFTADGSARFIDPLPMAGNPLFDWSFWTVYYDLDRNPADRLDTAARTGEIPVRALLPWCIMQCLDGLLFYIETADSRVPRMTEVLRMLCDCQARLSPDQARAGTGPGA